MKKKKFISALDAKKAGSGMIMGLTA